MRTSTWYDVTMRFIWDMICRSPDYKLCFVTGLVCKLELVRMLRDDTKLLGKGSTCCRWTGRTIVLDLVHASNRA
jgi:hypothetical protein